MRIDRRIHIIHGDSAWHTANDVMWMRGFYHQIQREELRYHVDGQEYSNNGIQPSNEPLVVINYSLDDPTIEQRKIPNWPDSTIFLTFCCTAAKYAVVALGNSLGYAESLDAVSAGAKPLIL